MEARGYQHENFRGLYSRAEFACGRIDRIHCSEFLGDAGMLRSTVYPTRSTHVAQSQTRAFVEPGR
jgi:hypothetical protein